MSVKVFGRPVDLSKAPGNAAVAGRIQAALTGEVGGGFSSPTMGAPFSVGDNRLTASQMGPGQPAQVFPLGGEPRQWQYRVGSNFPTTPDSDRGIDEALLRDLSRSYYLLRRCIERRKSELCSYEWDIIPRERNMDKARHVAREHADLIAEIKEFFAHPEGYFTNRNGKWIREPLIDWQDWLRALLEDVFVGDWMTIWPQKTYGGKLVGFRRVDGAKIKPIIDLDGRTPPPPLPAYQIYEYGAPRASYAVGDLFYWPHNLRNDSQYGYSHVEQALMNIYLGIQFDQWNKTTFGDSTIPMGLLETPEKMTPEQIQDIADFLNQTIAGNLAERQRLQPVPSGTKFEGIKVQEFSSEYAYYLIELTTLALDLMPSELGFAPNRAALGGSGWAEEQQNQAQKNRISFAYWVQSRMTQLVHRFWGDRGGDLLEFSFSDLVRDDSQARWEANDKAIRSGQMKLDEAIEKAGGDPTGFERFIETPVGVILPAKNLVITSKGVLPIEAGASTGNDESDDADTKRPAGSPGALKFGLDSGMQPHDLGNSFADEATGWLVDEGEREDARVEELRRWRRRTLRDHKDGKPLTKAFRSDKLPQQMKRHIIEHLKEATTADAIKAAFDEAQKAAKDDRKRKEEEVFVAAYLLLFRMKLREIEADAAIRPETLMRQFEVDASAIAEQIHILKRSAYMSGYNEGLGAIGMEPVSDLPPGVDGRLRSAAQEAANAITETYKTQLSAQVDALIRDTQGMEQEERVNYIVNAIKKWVRDHMKWKAEEIAATEAEKAASQGFADAIRSHVKTPMLRWVARMDEKTCDVCRSRNGKVFPLESYDTMPSHPNCRCRWQAVDFAEQPDGSGGSPHGPGWGGPSS